MPRRARKLTGPYGKEPDLKDPGSDVYAPRPPKAKKNLKDFCRGNPATPHTPALGHKQYAFERTCGWHEWYSGGRPNGRYRYSCWHREECTRCGKVTRQTLEPEQCPVFVPKPEPRR
jgi:hypothetical protein